MEAQGGWRWMEGWQRLQKMEEYQHGRREWPTWRWRREGKGGERRSCRGKVEHGGGWRLQGEERKGASSAGRVAADGGNGVQRSRNAQKGLEQRMKSGMELMSRVRAQSAGSNSL